MHQARQYRNLTNIKKGLSLRHNVNHYPSATSFKISISVVGVAVSDLFHLIINWLSVTPRWLRYVAAAFAHCLVAIQFKVQMRGCFGDECAEYAVFPAGDELNPTLLLMINTLALRAIAPPKERHKPIIRCAPLACSVWFCACTVTEIVKSNSNAKTTAFCIMRRSKQLQANSFKNVRIKGAASNSPSNRSRKPP